MANADDQKGVDHLAASMSSVATPTIVPGSHIQRRSQPSPSSPGSAEHLSSLIQGLSLSCPHFPKYRVDAVNTGARRYPSRLGFFHRPSLKARITYLDTRKLCIECLKLVIPRGFNFWSSFADTSKQGGSRPQRGWLNATPSDQSYPQLLQAGTEGFPLLSSPSSSPTNRATFLSNTIFIPQDPFAKEAWEWMQSDGKPFYMDQLHLTKGWNFLAERAAEFDAKIAQNGGFPFSPSQLRETENHHSMGFGTYGTLIADYPYGLTEAFLETKIPKTKGQTVSFSHEETNHVNEVVEPDPVFAHARHDIGSQGINQTPSTSPLVINTKSSSHKPARPKVIMGGEAPKDGLTGKRHKEESLSPRPPGKQSLPPSTSAKTPVVSEPVKNATEALKDKKSKQETDTKPRKRPSTTHLGFSSLESTPRNQTGSSTLHKTRTDGNCSPFIEQADQSTESLKRKSKLQPADVPSILRVGGGTVPRRTMTGPTQAIASSEPVPATHQNPGTHKSKPLMASQSNKPSTAIKPKNEPPTASVSNAFVPFTPPYPKTLKVKSPTAPLPKKQPSTTPASKELLSVTEENPKATKTKPSTIPQLKQKLPPTPQLKKKPHAAPTTGLSLPFSIVNPKKPTEGPSATSQLQKTPSASFVPERPPPFMHLGPAKLKGKRPAPSKHEGNPSFEVHAMGNQSSASQASPYTSNWCQHNPIPFDYPIETPSLKDYQRQAATPVLAKVSEYPLPLRKLFGKHTLKRGKGFLADKPSEEIDLLSMMTSGSRSGRPQGKGKESPRVDPAAGFVKSVLEKSSTKRRTPGKPLINGLSINRKSTKTSQTSKPARAAVNAKRKKAGPGSKGSRPSDNPKKRPPSKMRGGAKWAPGKPVATSRKLRENGGQQMSDAKNKIRNSQKYKPNHKSPHDSSSDGEPYSGLHKHHSPKGSSSDSDLSTDISSTESDCPTNEPGQLSPYSPSDEGCNILDDPTAQLDPNLSTSISGTPNEDNPMEPGAKPGSITPSHETEPSMEMDDPMQPETRPEHDPFPSKLDESCVDDQARLTIESNHAPQLVYTNTRDPASELDHQPLPSELGQTRKDDQTGSTPQPSHPSQSTASNTGDVIPELNHQHFPTQLTEAHRGDETEPAHLPQSTTTSTEDTVSTPDQPSFASELAKSYGNDQLEPTTIPNHPSHSTASNTINTTSELGRPPSPTKSAETDVDNRSVSSPTHPLKVSKDKPSTTQNESKMTDASHPTTSLQDTPLYPSEWAKIGLETNQPAYPKKVGASLRERNNFSPTSSTENQTGVSPSNKAKEPIASPTQSVTSSPDRQFAPTSEKRAASPAPLPDTPGHDRSHQLVEGPRGSVYAPLTKPTDKIAQQPNTPLSSSQTSNELLTVNSARPVVSGERAVPGNKRKLDIGVGKENSNPLKYAIATGAAVADAAAVGLAVSHSEHRSPSEIYHSPENTTNNNNFAEEPENEVSSNFGDFVPKDVYIGLDQKDANGHSGEPTGRIITSEYNLSGTEKERGYGHELPGDDEHDWESDSGDARSLNEEHYFAKSDYRTYESGRDDSDDNKIEVDSRSEAGLHLDTGGEVGYDQLYIREENDDISQHSVDDWDSSELEGYQSCNVSAMSCQVEMRDEKSSLNFDAEASQDEDSVLNSEGDTDHSQGVYPRGEYGDEGGEEPYEEYQDSYGNTHGDDTSEEEEEEDVDEEQGSGYCDGDGDDSEGGYNDSSEEEENYGNGVSEDFDVEQGSSRREHSDEEEEDEDEESGEGECGEGEYGEVEEEEEYEEYGEGEEYGEYREVEDYEEYGEGEEQEEYEEGEEQEEYGEVEDYGEYGEVEDEEYD